MHFFLTQILARAVAFYLFIDTVRQLWAGLVERKIAIWNPDLLDWLLGWFQGGVHRDTSPFWYWVQIVVHVVIATCCLLMVFFGWYEPNG